MTKVYFDSAYLVKCYLTDPGSAKIRKLATASEHVYSSALCLVEFSCAVHRAVREKTITANQAADVRRAFALHVREGVVALIPISDSILDSAQAFVAMMPADLFLRAGDALHLASARDEGFSEIWSNDRHLLNAASHFGIIGCSL